MIIEDKQLEQELEKYNILIEEVKPRKTLWALYEPRPFEQDGIQYKARIGLGQDLKGKARYLIILHELAHYKADKQYGWGIRPHGKEWQAIYKELVEKYQYLFPGQDVLSMFDRYTARKENNLVELLSTK